MKLISAIVGLVAGDVSHLQGQSGYHYQVPQTSYGVPSHQVSAPQYSTSYKGYQTQQGTNGYQVQPAANQGYQLQQGAALGHQQAQHTGFGQQTTSQGYQSSGNQYQTGSNQNGYVNANQYQTTGQSAVHAPASYPWAAQQGNQYQTGSAYQSSVVQKYQEYFKQQQQQQPAQVYKHFYVHAAPEEPEQPRFRQPITLPAPQKHYKIIFIKTPTHRAPEPQLVPVQQQNEEKTIVYVLVPKPEEAKQVVVPQIEQKPPAKPEVFFIKYHGKEGSEAVINNIVNDYNSNKGGSASVQYTGLQDTGVSDVSGDSSSFTQSSVGQTGLEQQSQIVQQSEQQIPQYFADDVKTATAEAASSGYQGVAESSAVVQGGAVSSDVQNEQSFSNTISTSQGVPHENYGVPKFRDN